MICWRKRAKGPMKSRFLANNISDIQRVNLGVKVEDVANRHDTTAVVKLKNSTHVDAT